MQKRSATSVIQRWISTHLSEIFPDAKEERDLCNSALDSYMFHWQPGGLLLPLLHDIYLKAIERLGETRSEAGHTQDPTERLAEHLMLLYVWGQLSSNDVLLREFFLKASDAIRGHAMRFIGFDLYHGKQAVTPETMGGLTALYDERLKVASATIDKKAHKSELAAFGWWFANNQFDKGWSIERLLEVLGMVGTLDMDHLVVEQLAQISPEMPEQCVESIRLLAEGDKEGFGIYGWQEHAHTVLGVALNSGNPNARLSAVGLINRLEARGYSGFRDLLNDGCNEEHDTKT